MSSLSSFGRSGSAFRRGILAGAVLGATTLFAVACDDDGGSGAEVAFQTPVISARNTTVAIDGGDAQQPGSGGGVASGTVCPSPSADAAATGTASPTAEGSPGSPTPTATVAVSGTVAPGGSAVAGVGAGQPC